jgi:hypothetical protein
MKALGNYDFTHIDNQYSSNMAKEFTLEKVIDIGAVNILLKTLFMAKNQVQNHPNSHPESMEISYSYKDSKISIRIPKDNANAFLVGFGVSSIILGVIALRYANRNSA